MQNQIHQFWIKGIIKNGNQANCNRKRSTNKLIYVFFPVGIRQHKENHRHHANNKSQGTKMTARNQFRHSGEKNDFEVGKGNSEIFVLKKRQENNVYRRTGGIQNNQWIQSKLPKQEHVKNMNAQTHN
ncbi:MAG: hypothetical protein IKM81_11840 [Fibrobacter sp.]|nr:hypothetical protein [Fibrobacter sp.]